MSQFDITAHHANDGVVRLAVIGELDISTVEQVTAAITTALDNPDTVTVVIDLDRVTFLDSSTVGALVRGRNLAASRGRGYRVVNAHGTPLRVLSLTGVLEALTGGDPPAATSSPE